MPAPITKISAKLSLLLVDEGGRKFPIHTGYRPTVYFEQKQTDSIVSFHHDELLRLGKEYIVTLGLIHPEHLGDALKKNALFDCREGSKIVARCVVLDIKT